MSGSRKGRYRSEADQPLLYTEKGPEADQDPFSYEQKVRQKRSQCMFCAIFLTALMMAGLVTALVIVAGQTGAGPPGELPAAFRRAAVACDSAQCSTVGKTILQRGGNAVDASIAALLCNGLTAPQSMGIGGGFFMTIYNSQSGVSTIIDAREVAPGAATRDMFVGNPDLSTVGGLSIAVLAEVKGYWHAHQKYGRLPWSDLFQPAIKMAADGFPVPIGLHKAIQDDVELLTTEPSLRSVFFNSETNKVFQLDEIMRRPQLAETMRVIAREGMEALYNGSLTEDLLSDLKNAGSIINRDDLEKYTVLEKRPLEVTLDNGLKVVSPPPPSGGLVLSFILNILDGYEFKPEDISTEDAAALTYHRFIESFKFGYAKRTNLGDEDFVDVSELVKNLTSRAYADTIRHRISDTSTYNYTYYGPTYYDRNTTGTSHLSALDQDGMAVAVTSTVNARFGSQRRGIKTGIIFNDEMDDFSSPNITNYFGLRPSPANFIVPGKRPLSSMCPAVFVNSDGSVAKVLGAAGGSKITTAVAWVAAQNMWFGKNIRAAIDSRRLHHQLLPPWIQFEEGFDQDLVEDFHKFGHNTTQYSLGGSISQGIDVEGDMIYANCDFRKGGKPDGY